MSYQAGITIPEFSVTGMDGAVGQTTWKKMKVNQFRTDSVVQKKNRFKSAKPPRLVKLLSLFEQLCHARGNSLMTSHYYVKRNPY